MRGDAVKTTVLSARLIPNADPALRRALGVREGHRSLALITTDCDDVTYAALDEATKKAQVEVAFAASMYAGASNASTALAGEFVGILSASAPDDARSGLEAALDFARRGASFYSANDAGTIVYFAHCIARTGSYLSAQAGVPRGTALAYLIAPPLEAALGLDAALKAAQVELRRYYEPPTQTNFSGGLLSGEQAACQAACEAFARAVCAVAEEPILF